MDRDMKRGMLIGAILGVIFFGAVLSYVGYMTYFSNTPEQKAAINEMNGLNCTKCMADHHINCTAETVQYSPWGAICNNTYVDKNCTTCRRI